MPTKRAAAVDRQETVSTLDEFTQGCELFGRDLCMVRVKHQRIVVAEGTHAATRLVTILNSLAARIALLLAERVGVRPIRAKVRAGTLRDGCCLGVGPIRTQHQRIQHERECRCAGDAKQPCEAASGH